MRVLGCRANSIINKMSLQIQQWLKRMEIRFILVYEPEGYYEVNNKTRLKFYYTQKV